MIICSFSVGIWVSDKHFISLRCVCVCVQYILAVHYFTAVPVEHCSVNRAGLKSDAEGISGKINSVCVCVYVCVCEKTSRNSFKPLLFRPYSQIPKQPFSPPPSSLESFQEYLHPNGSIVNDSTHCSSYSRGSYRWRLKFTKNGEEETKHADGDKACALYTNRQ